MRAALLVLLLIATGPVPAAPADEARAAMRAGNFAEAYCIWRALADDGDADAQYNVGWLYHNGYGLAINDREAVTWWEKAAGQGHRDATFALGNLYRLGGRDVGRDPARALGYFLDAARKGDEDAVLLLRTLLATNNPAVRERSADLLRDHASLFGPVLSVGAPRANLREGAGTQHGVMTVLTEGMKLVELERSGQWVQVGVPETGIIGWLHDSLVQ